MENSRPISVGTCATLACVWEATAPKPGNVYRGADFDDMTYADFLASAAVIGPVIERCGEWGLGRTVLEGVQATQKVVAVNTNLGVLLLLAPLAQAVFAGRHRPAEAGPPDKVGPPEADAKHVYEAIRLASPGGLGQVASGDVGDEPQHSLLEAMRLAADRDLLARQYTNGFAEVHQAANLIEQRTNLESSLSDAIVLTHVTLIAEHGDSLVERKLGREASGELSDRAAEVIRAVPGSEEYQQGLADFDFYLRADGHRRNPGTTADLIAAALFVLLTEDRLSWPVRFYSTPSA